MTDVWLRDPQENTNDVRLTADAVIDLVVALYTNPNIISSIHVLGYFPYVRLVAGLANLYDIRLINPISLDTNLGTVLYSGVPYVNISVFSWTNYVENSTMVGAVAGSPGTLPTYWFDVTT